MTAVRTPKQLVGVTDGTVIPPKLADGREYGASTRTFIASKVTGTIWAATNTVTLCKKPAGHKVTSVKLVTGTSLGSTTIDVGVAGAVDKYVDGATLTTVDRLTEIGVRASAMDDDPGAEENLIATILTADIPANVLLTFVIETVGIS